MTPSDASQQTEALCRLAPVIPVLVVDDAAHARPLAGALVAGGLPVLEVTLRTPAALDVIREMSLVEAVTDLSPALMVTATLNGRRESLGCNFWTSIFSFNFNGR